MNILKYVNLLLNYIFPPRCAFCYENMDAGYTELVCLKCKENLPYLLKTKTCQKCGKPVKYNKSSCICGLYGLDERCYERSIAVFAHNEMIESSILRYKKNQKRQYAAVYAAYLAVISGHYYNDVKFDYIISIPMTKDAVLERGFNQTKEIAVHLSKIINIPYLEEAMIKMKNTRKQRGLTREERIQNLKDSFEVNKHKELEGKTVLIVDDVFTTGSTINECARTLKNAGVSEVYAATVSTTILN